MFRFRARRSIATSNSKRLTRHIGKRADVGASFYRPIAGAAGGRRKRSAKTTSIIATMHAETAMKAWTYAIEVERPRDAGMVEGNCERDLQHGHSDSIATSLHRGQNAGRRAYEMVLDAAEHCVQDRGHEQPVANALQQQRWDQILR